LAQKPFVGSYSVAILNKTSGFVTGDYWMGMSYNGDALMLKDLNPQLKFVIPQEGTALWCDYLTIMQTSENKAAAFKFIDFMNQPKNAAQLAQYVRYASPNQAAEKLLPPEYLSNPLIYPSKAVLERSETGIALPPRINKTRTSIYNQLLH
ncbi:ABC transporter substrate-binding protein, partial [Candidatus Venteria ishoeyi]